jgi:hypothetical protein
MKRYFAVALLVGAIGFGVPAHADNLAPCVSQDGMLAAQAGLGQAVAGDPLTCSYVTASGSQAILVLTPLDVRLTATHLDEQGRIVVDADLSYGGTSDPTKQGPAQLSLPSGDTVTVTMSADCVPSDPTGQGCGWVGAVVVADTPL